MVCFFVGFGNALARRLASRGATVYAGCLFPDGEGASVLRSETDGVIHVVNLDVRSDKSVEDVYTKIQGEDPGHSLWCVVNNAAINFMGDVEFCTMEMYRRIADVNMFGVVRVTKRFIGMVRKEKGEVSMYFIFVLMHLAILWMILGAHDLPSL